MNQIDFVEITFLVLAWLIFIFFGVMFNNIYDRYNDNDSQSFLNILYGTLIGITLTTIYVIDQPRTIDVYRNNTELKLTYEIVGNDTLNIDSVVVFKK